MVTLHIYSSPPDSSWRSPLLLGRGAVHRQGTGRRLRVVHTDQRHGWRSVHRATLPYAYAPLLFPGHSTHMLLSFPPPSPSTPPSPARRNLHVGFVARQNVRKQHKVHLVLHLCVGLYANKGGLCVGQAGGPAHQPRPVVAGKYCLRTACSSPPDALGHAFHAAMAPPTPQHPHPTCSPLIRSLAVRMGAAWPGGQPGPPLLRPKGRVGEGPFGWQPWSARRRRRRRRTYIPRLAPPPGDARRHPCRDLHSRTYPPDCPRPLGLAPGRAGRPLWRPCSRRGRARAP